MLQVQKCASFRQLIEKVGRTTVMTGKALHSTRMPAGLRQLFFLVVLCLFALPVWAQFDTGTINGTVTDPSGAAVAGAQVTVTNTATGQTSTATTNSTGFFTVSALPFGNYVVSAESKGFSLAKSPVVNLNVRAIVHVNLAMAIAGENQKIEVTGTQSTVNTETSATGTRLNEKQVTSLPMNGRDVSNFLEVAQGSVSSTGFFQGSVNGLENIFTGLNVTVDGQNASRGDLNGYLDTEGQELARVTRASLDSIQEIDFTNNGYGAEHGRSLGPQMNIITKSGTNGFHGTAFEYLRNDALDAKDFFNTGPAVPLRLNQFGGNLGGPIVKNKLFFFVNYEGDRTHITNINSLYQIPSAFVRSQITDPRMAPVVAQMAPLPAGCTGIPAPSFCAVPGSEDPSNPAGGAQLVYSPAALQDRLREDTGSIRVDYNPSQSDRMFFRYNINDSLTNHTFGLNQGQVSPQKLRTQLGKFDETHVFSPSLLNQFSISINRFFSDTNSNTPQPLVGFSGFFVNLGSLPGPNTFNQVTPFNVFEVFDSVSKTAGRHTIRAGVQFRANQLNEWLRPQQTYFFGSFHDLETDNPFVLSKIGFPNFVGITSQNYGFYVQDNWKVLPNLTLDFGLRYDYNTVWRERHDQQQNFDIASQALLPASQDAYTAPKSDFAPRLGISWDPWGTGKNVFHAYAGMFYMPMQFSFGLVTNIPEFQSYNVNVFDAFFGGFSIAYPSPNPPLQPGTANVTAFPQNPRDPMSTNWLVGYERELAPGTVLGVNYTGNKAVHMQAAINFAAVNVNPANTVTQARPHSGFANENLAADNLFSTYNALQVQLKRKAGRMNFEANYTWSHEIDDLVNVFSGWSNPLNPSADVASGDWDVRHNFTGSIVYTFPDTTFSNRFARALVNGWETGNVVQIRSGLPTNVQLISGFFGLPMRPDFVSGQSPTMGSGDWPKGNFNPNAFTIPPGFNGAWGQNQGNVGRNALRGPGFFQWDMSMMKNFPITEALKLQFRTDFFNILNHPNFANPDGGICTAVTPATSTSPASCAPNPNFGRVGQTIADNLGSQIGNGTSRQIQFALKLIF